MPHIFGLAASCGESWSAGCRRGNLARKLELLVQAGHVLVGVGGGLDPEVLEWFIGCWAVGPGARRRALVGLRTVLPGGVSIVLAQFVWFRLAQQQQHHHVGCLCCCWWCWCGPPVGGAEAIRPPGIAGFDATSRF